VPFVPPPVLVAEQIFDSMAIAFRALECELHKASGLYARQKRDQNPNMIFQDLKPHADKGVGILTRARQTRIVDVNHAEEAIVLEPPIRFESEHAIYCNGKALTPIHVEDDCLWLEDTSDLQVGMPISQPIFQGTDQELFTLFSEAWKQMWDRHRHVSPDRWAQILSFARQHLPRGSFSWAPLDAPQLQHCIAHKKATTSGGLDGVSLVDLKAMPPAALTNFIHMFQEAEETGEWPSQVIAGRVTCLAKVEEPQHALDFRPITVIGLLYRCWGTFNAKQAIRRMESALPVGLFGSRPQCFAGQVWSQLLWTIELAYHSDTSLSGIIADLRKAFNYLPRAVVMECCALVGLPFRVLRAWSGALSGMQRRFQVNGSLGPPISSTCGLPEGCALSCVGMMVVDMIYHAWMLHYFPLCQPLSYVDDWQVLLTDPANLLPAFQCLEGFVQAMDLSLDQRKTSTWSITAEGRQCIRRQGFGMVASCKNLGAHVQFTKQHTNKTMMDRVAKVSPLWAKLRLSPSAYQQKIRAIKCAAWPMGLHGIAATTLSLATFQSLRAGAMKGLKADSPGANAWVQLGLIEKCSTDPHVWATLQTFRLTRDCGSQPRVEEVMAEIAAGQDHLPSNSITHTLVTRIQLLRWQVTTDGKLQDMIGGFSLFQVSIAELNVRVELHWPFVVAAVVSHRPCFQGISSCDPDAARRWLGELDSSDRALFRKILNGAHITQDGKKHCQESDSDVCPFCPCSDSRFHRFWECPQFASHRKHLSKFDLNTVVSLPECLTACGWALHPTTQWEWLQHLASVPNPCPRPLQLTGPLHLFTDGSCHNQHCAVTRFAGWSVILASFDWVSPPGSSRELAVGHLPGILQSAVRAETFAVLQALLLTQDHPDSVTIWTDCEAVVKKLRRVLAGHDIAANSASR